MISISLCMIVKDENQLLPVCLNSIKDIVDEIIIVNMNPKNNTEKIAETYGAKVFNFKWKNDFSEVRNYSFSNATKDYILWLDSDNIFLEDDRIKLMELKKTLNNNVDIVMMKNIEYFNNLSKQKISFFRERLLKRSKNYMWKSPVHEYINLNGNILVSDICINQIKGRTDFYINLAIYKKMLSRHRFLSPENLYYYAKELLHSGKYDLAINNYNKFLNNKKTYANNKICACYELAKCYEHKGESKNRFQTLIRSFMYGTPRAEICCELGYLYKNKNKFNTAIFWFKSALMCEKPQRPFGFTIENCSNYIPSIETSLCYYSLGDISNAIKYNNLAGKYKPYDPSVLYNKKFYTTFI